MLTDRKISIVIACYSDAGSVREFHKRISTVMPSVAPDYEIIYVNDASPDYAEEILAEIAISDPRLVIVNHTRNFGSQNAFLSGMAVSRGDAVILMDGDLQDPPQLIPQMIERWLEGYPVVYGRRVKRKESVGRQVAYKLFYRLFRHMAAFPVPLDAGDFGLLDRQVVNTMLEDFPESLPFLRGLRAYTGFRSIGVDYIRDARYDGTSTNNLMGNVRWAKLAIFSFSKKPLEYISLLAFISVIISFLFVVFYSAAYVLSRFYPTVSPPPGFMTLLLVSLMLSSVQLICFSILAEYLGHIYEEVKHRPKYIVRSIIDNRAKILAKRSFPE